MLAMASLIAAQTSKASSLASQLLQVLRCFQISLVGAGLLAMVWSNHRPGLVAPCFSLALRIAVYSPGSTPLR
jgi:hypothetical protein